MSAPEITAMVPVFAIGSHAEAVDFYLNWLGFKLDWEWRAQPGAPVIMAISRDAAALMLNEAALATGPGWLTVSVSDLDGLAAEWNQRRPDSATVLVGAPYDIPTVSLEDPFGNHIDFQQPISAAETELREQRGAQMRVFIRAERERGNPCPTPDELVAVIGPPVGLAMDVLCEFPDYGAS